MARKKKINEIVSLHPVMTFIIMILCVIVISGFLSLFNLTVTYNSFNSIKNELFTSTDSITSLLNLRGVKYIFSNTVLNFANFAPLSHLIIVLIGIGVMEYSGFLRTAIGLLTKHAKKNVITFVIVLLCILSSILDNLPFVAFVPIAALIYKYGKRNPSIGVIASFAGLTSGYGLSILFTSVDSSLATITSQAARLLDATYTFNSFGTVIIMLVASILLAFVITYITEEKIALKLPKYNFDENEVFDDGIINKSELKGLVLAGLGAITYLLIFIYNIIPGLPFSGNFLNYSEAVYIDKLFGANSFFANGFVFIITILFIICGLLYGIGAKTIKNNQEFVDSLGYSLNGIGKTLLILFIGATFISVFKQTNIGSLVVEYLSYILSTTKFTGLALVIMLFVFSAISTFFVPGTIVKWSILAYSAVPAFMNVGLSAEFAQVVFRFGECATLAITPLFAYFVVYLAYLDKYNQQENSFSLLKSIKYQLPYSICTAALLLSLIIIWYIISLPLGFGGSIAI